MEDDNALLWHFLYSAAVKEKKGVMRGYFENTRTRHFQDELPEAHPQPWSPADESSWQMGVTHPPSPSPPRPRASDQTTPIQETSPNVSGLVRTNVSAFPLATLPSFPRLFPWLSTCLLNKRVAEGNVSGAENSPIIK